MKSVLARVYEEVTGEEKKKLLVLGEKSNCRET